MSKNTDANTQRKSKGILRTIITAALIFALLAIAIAFIFIVIPEKRYEAFLNACNYENYAEIQSIISELPADRQKQANDELYARGVNKMQTPPDYGEKYFKLITEDRSSEINHEYFAAGENAYKNGDVKLARVLYNLAGAEGVEPIKMLDYEYALEMLANGQYQAAMAAFERLGEFKDCREKYAECEAGIYNFALKEIDEKDFSKARQYLDQIPDYEERSYGYDVIRYYEGLDMMENADWEGALRSFWEISDQTAFSELEDSIRVCSESIDYISAANTVIGILLKNVDEGQIVADEINRILAMPTGGVKEDYSAILNTELKYLNWYGRYLGTWECVSVEGASFKYADQFSSLFLKGDDSFYEVDRSRFVDGSYTSEDERYVLSGSNLKMLFNRQWSTFRLKPSLTKGNFDIDKSSKDNTASQQESTNRQKFTNAYGTPTTKCAHYGCNNYIASSGDTNCCTVHSNKCADCGKYIDEDAMYCMSCLNKAAGSTSQSTKPSSGNKSSSGGCQYKYMDGSVCGAPTRDKNSNFCEKHFNELTDAYNSFVGN